MPASLALAATLVAMAWLVGEQGISRSTALRQIFDSPRAMARFLIGAVLIGAITGAAATRLLQALPSIAAALIGWLVASLAMLALLRARHGATSFAALSWLAVTLALLFAALSCIAREPRDWLIGGFALAFALGLGLPAFAALGNHLDDADVPAAMRPFPARFLAAGIVALALAGSLSW